MLWSISVVGICQFCSLYICTHCSVSPPLTGKYNVNIVPTNSPYEILDKGGRNFTFLCSVTGPKGNITNPNITLLIPGSDKKLANVNSTRPTNASVLFTYNITSYTDDQTVFVCQYNSSNQTWLSSNLTLTVFCECKTLTFPFHFVL